jgi:hypothetical protein
MMISCKHFTCILYESRCTCGCSPSLIIIIHSLTVHLILSINNEEFPKRVNSISEEWGQTHVFRLECKVLWLESLS